MTELQPMLLGKASWGPIWLAQGGADWVIDDSDDDGDPFADSGGGGDDADDDEPDEPPQTKTRRKARQADPDEDEPDDDPEDVDDEWIPPSRSDWEKLREALKRNNGQNARLRHADKTLKRLNITDLGEFLAQHGIDPTSGQKLTDEPDPAEGEAETNTPPATPTTPTKTSTAQDKARQALAVQRAADKASAEAEARYKPALVASAAKAAFMDAGWASKDFGLAMRLLDLDEIEVDFGDGTETAELVGLEEQIERVKKSFPALFRKRRAPEQSDELASHRRRRTGARDIDAGDRGRQDGKPQNWLDKVNRQLG